MRSILLVAAITMREAVRRRVWLGLIVILIGMAIVDFTAPPGMQHASRLGGDSAERLRRGIELAQFLGARIILFFTSVMAVLLASGQLGAEVERGVLATILTKPIRRFQVVLGKWLGVIVFADAVVLVSYAANWLLLGLRYGFQSGVALNAEALGVMLLYPVLYGTITLTWSSFANMALSLLLTAVLYAATFIGDFIVVAIAELTDNQALRDLEVLSRWVIPHQRLGEWLFSVETGLATTLIRAMGKAPEGTLFDKVYIFLYIAAFLWFAHLAFSRRDVQ